MFIDYPIVIRVDEELKEEATKLYKSMGLDMTTAIKLFLTQSIPFTLKAYDSTCYDNNGRYISDEELESAKLWLKQYVKEGATARKLDVNSREDMVFILFHHLSVIYELFRKLKKHLIITSAFLTTNQ
ncbi:type II toxin-antitoxin system RelB/DinJ family antitoxin [Streptococcus sp. AN2]|nr:type II toxin-antitoxin system RelB/DinJ family antitoxin [Streptococcus sp. AN2]